MKTMMNTKEGGKEQSYILRKFKVNETSLKLMKLHHANHRRRGYIRKDSSFVDQDAFY